jgi:hypothetical protein
MLYSLGAAVVAADAGDAGGVIVTVSGVLSGDG